jgi:hypothetical protein
MTVGVRLVSGSRLKLDALRLPSGWVTTDEAIGAFLGHLTSDRAGSSIPESNRETAASRKAVARVDRTLDALGL